MVSLSNHERSATSAVFSYGVTTGRSMKLAWPGA